MTIKIKTWVLFKYSELKFKRTILPEDMSKIMICARFENPVILGTKVEVKYFTHMSKVYNRLFKKY